MLIPFLNDLASSAAKDVDRLLDKGELRHYKKYLNSMYHYALQSGPQLTDAAAKLQEYPEYAFLFSELARDEESHYRLAEKDLLFFSVVPSAQPPCAVHRINTFWTALPRHRSIGYLGVMYVLENVAKHIDIHRVHACFERLRLSKLNTRFISAHLQVDVRHGALLEQACSGVTEPSHQAMIIDAATGARELWVAMHDDAYDDGEHSDENGL